MFKASEKIDQPMKATAINEDGYDFLQSAIIKQAYTDFKNYYLHNDSKILEVIKYLKNVPGSIAQMQKIKERVDSFNRPIMQLKTYKNNNKYLKTLNARLNDVKYNACEVKKQIGEIKQANKIFLSDFNSVIKKMQNQEHIGLLKKVFIDGESITKLIKKDCKVAELYEQAIFEYERARQNES